MTKLFMFEKPLGMRDTLPLLYAAKQKVRDRMLKEISSWGYRMLQTPALEYYDTVGEVSAIEDRQLFKLLDQQGQTLVLRPDMTTPIARVAASRLLNKRNPHRLAYSATVYRAQQRDGGRPAEFEQIGVECIGDPSVSMDAESIALLVSVLKKAGLRDFKISIGHIGFVQKLFLHVLGNEERAEQCRKLLFEKNYVGYREHIESLQMSSIDKEMLLSLLLLRSEGDILEKAKQLLNNEQGISDIRELEELWEQLKEYDVQRYVSFDLTAVSHMNYYTGILFEAYADKIGQPVASGGRYDNLLGKFGRQAPATGFGIMLDRLMETLGDMTEEKDSYCIIYSHTRRKDAIERAAELRSIGNQVVMQEMSGVRFIDEFMEGFREVEYLIGNREGKLDE
ncbi:MAG: ATP phosphoribosyltransferase regulatory subunit [Bacillus sp. (in: firmicutes)]